VSGLDPSTTYRFRLVAANANGPNFGQSVSFASGTPKVETTGSPIRTATTARFEGRLQPHGVLATYHFEYGTQGACDAHPCESTEPQDAGSGSQVELVSQLTEGLSAGTTYHYRLVGENSAGLAFGDDMTVTTRADDAPLFHGHFPGPPGSDRAYEQVNLPETSGNPITGAEAVSDDGNRVIYRTAGGNPLAQTGTIYTPLFAERTASGWRSENIFPLRRELAANSWIPPAGRGDLSDQISYNFNIVTSAATLWRVRPGLPAEKVYEPVTSQNDGLALISRDASRALMVLKGSIDPDHPAANGQANLYDVTSGTPHLVDLMPDGSVCGVVHGQGGYPEADVPRSVNWVSPDGSRVFFYSGSEGSCTGGLYMRDLESEETKLISGPPISGPQCGVTFIRSGPEAAFFRTASRLASDDNDPENCKSGSGDIYRYDTGNGAYQCLTCTTEDMVVVSEEGPVSYGKDPFLGAAGELGQGVNQVGERVDAGETMAPDGSVLIFRSNSPRLNAVGGLQNGGTYQYYRFDARDRSLVCVSCPQDGSVPTESVPQSLITPQLSQQSEGANLTTLSADGETFAFTTATALVGADQNTAPLGHNPLSGTDAYEWRDGRVMLVTDGLTNWPGDEVPRMTAMSPSGRDVFFLAAAQYTPDALDGYRRLYDARIGGGFEFPPPPKPCPLEVCQGTPKGAPEEAEPGSSSLRAPGNKASANHKKKKKHHKKAHRRHRKANSNRRAAR
jgi:hypothetical protein